MNREKRLAYQKQYNDINRDKIKEYNNQYYLKHRPNRVKYNKISDEERIQKRKNYLKNYQIEYRKQKKEERKKEKIQQYIEAINNPIEVSSNTLIDYKDDIFIGFKVDKKGNFYLEW